MRTRPPLYRTYMNMKQRCMNPNHDMYKHYWGRGISICTLWLQWYKYFYESILDVIWPKPSSKHTLDRIDNNWDYSPSNIKWSDRQEQFNNRSDNVVIDWKTLAQWARYYNVTRGSFWKMYKRLWFIWACNYYNTKLPKEIYNWLTHTGIAELANVSNEAVYYHKKKWKSIKQIYDHFLT